MKNHRTLKIMVMILFIGIFMWLMTTEAETNQKEHPVIKPIPGFILDDSSTENFSSYTFKIHEKGGSIDKKVKGKYWFFYYENKKSDRKFSKLEIIENHKKAALEKGGKILSADDTKLDFTVPLTEGGTLWVHLHTWEDSYELYIIEEKGFKKRLSFTAKEMKKELDSAGHVAIYGIYFDLDQSTLKPGSEKILIEMVKLMKNFPDLRVEIQGHTDSTGTRDHNITLSQQRAKTVQSFLNLYGIELTRMTIKGYGPDQPVASNYTDEGRALNRRVELKKR